VATVGYDEATHALEVEFKDGSVYQYVQVPAGVYAGLLAGSSRGESVGRYLDLNIKKAGYQYTKVATTTSGTPHRLVLLFSRPVNGSFAEMFL
jgi:hypothetical protein